MDGTIQNWITKLYKKILLTLFISLIWLNLRFYDDPIFTRYHAFLVLSFLFYLYFFSAINLLEIYNLITGETHLYLIIGAILIVSLQAYYLFYKKNFTRYLEEKKDIKPADYLLLIIFITATFGLTHFSMNLYKEVFNISNQP